MNSKNRTLVNRRRFIQTSLGLTIGSTLLGRNTLEVNKVGFFVKKLFRGATAVGKAIIITEVVLGVLRAFDIDIASSVTSFVQGFRRNSYPRIGVGNGAPPYERQISRPGYANSGCCQVGEYGYTTRRKRAKDYIWTPSINMWAATGNSEPYLKKVEKKIILKLEEVRCGYPILKVMQKPMKKGREYGGYTIIAQKFEKGKTRIIVDHSKPEDIENIYLRNIDEEVWSFS